MDIPDMVSLTRSALLACKKKPEEKADTQKQRKENDLGHFDPNEKNLQFSIIKILN